MGWVYTRVKWAYTHVGLGGVCMRKRLNFTLSEVCVCRLRELAECVYHKPMSQVVEPVSYTHLTLPTTPYV